jgi:signal transduction histidine kinase
MTRLPARLILLVPGLVLLGISAELILYGPDAPRIGRRDDLSLALIDLLTGWTVAATGLVAWIRAPASRTGPLLIASGAAWFVNNFSAVDAAILAAFAIWLEQLYRAPLLQAVLTFPSGRAATPAERAAVVVAWGVSLVPALWADPTVSMVLGMGLGGWCWLRLRRARRRAENGARARLAAAAMLGLAFSLPAIWTALGLGPLGTGGMLVYRALYVGSAILLATALLHPDRTAARLTQVVVELGDGPEPSLRATLAQLLADPTLALGTWDAHRRAYVDGQGGLVDPRPPAGRAVTFVPSGTGAGAIIVHDADLEEDPALARALAAAAALQATRDRLRMELRTQVDEVARSRDRLLVAAAQERIRLSDQLEQGAARRIRELGEPLGAIVSSARYAGKQGTVDATGAAEVQVARTLEELSSLARGLRVQTLAALGLRGALAEVVSWSSAAVDMDITTERLPQRVEDEAWFVCAEALTNAERHARASHIAITIRVDDGSLAVDVEDDGVGGADGVHGSGLQGLRRRIESTGGTLAIVSPPQGGTRVEARLPLGTVASNRSDVSDPPACTDVTSHVRAYVETPFHSQGGTR